MKNQKGFSLVELLVVVIIIAIIAAIAIPSLLASRRAANEASAISTLRTYHSAQATYFATTGANKDYAIAATNLTGLVDTILSGAASPVKSGYTFTLVGVASTSTADSKYCAGAAPQSSNSGTNFFGVSSANGGVVVKSTAAPPATLGCAAGDLATAGTPIQ